MVSVWHNNNNRCISAPMLSTGSNVTLCSGNCMLLSSCCIPYGFNCVNSKCMTPHPTSWTRFSFLPEWDDFSRHLSCIMVSMVCLCWRVSSESASAAAGGSALRVLSLCASFTTRLLKTTNFCHLGLAIPSSLLVCVFVTGKRGRESKQSTTSPHRKQPHNVLGKFLTYQSPYQNKHPSK